MFEIYPFGLEMPVPSVPVGEEKNILGGKGAGLHWMSTQGFSVPPGFVIPTSAYTEFKKAPFKTMKLIREQIKPYLAAMEQHFGYKPLLSVRSGARVSCPGMMDTILNVGLDSSTYMFWGEKLGVKAFDNSLQRLWVMYGSVVQGIDRHKLESTYAKTVYEQETGEAFPDTEAQILGSIAAVFKSWDNDRAKFYRKMHGYKDEWGTAVTVQAMVFGNLNDNSGTGVLFTRNPDTGENKIKGEFLCNAQGEDVVAGTATPMHLDKMQEWNPAVFKELCESVTLMEMEKKAVQDVEFTIENGKLYLLQTRDAKRTPRAAIKFALDMHKEGMLTAAEAAKRVSPREFDLAQQPSIKADWSKKDLPDYQGLSACSGVVSGVPVFSSEDAVNSKVPCILITKETTPDDIAGMFASVGIITMTGGATSHAAVVARGMNKPCITGLGGKVENFQHAALVGLDGSTGNIWLCEVPTEVGDQGLTSEFQALVQKVHGTIPVIFDVPAVEMKEALLHLGPLMVDIETATLKLKETSQKVKILYLDVSEAGLTDEEKIFSEMFGGPQWRTRFVQSMFPSMLPNKVILVGPSWDEFESVAATEDLHEMVMATKGLVVTGSANPAVQKVVDWQKKAGLEIISLGSKIDGCKSLVSFESLLQTTHQ